MCFEARYTPRAADRLDAVARDRLAAGQRPNFNRLLPAWICRSGSGAGSPNCQRTSPTPPAAGATPADVARTLVMIVDHTEERLYLLGAEFERVWEPGLKPACTLIPVPRLALHGMLFEIEATAVVRT